MVGVFTRDQQYDKKRNSRETCKLESVAATSIWDSEAFTLVPVESFSSCLEEEEIETPPGDLSIYRRMLQSSDENLTAYKKYEN